MMLNIQTVIRDEKYKAYIGLLCADIQVDSERLSDFELFSFLCENIDLIYGSPLKESLLAVLGRYAHNTAALCDRENQKRLWRHLNGDMCIPVEIAKNSDESNRVTLNETGRGRDILWIDECLLISNARQSSLENLIGNVIDSGKDIGVELAGLEFQRPDEYHAEIAYGKLQRGEACGPGEMFVIISWTICRVLMRRNTMLHILPDMQMRDTENMLGLLNARKLYPPTRIRICQQEQIEAACALCLNAAQKNISLEVVTAKEMNETILSDMLKTLLVAIPVTKIFVNNENADGKGAELLRAATDLI